MIEGLKYVCSLRTYLLIFSLIWAYLNYRILCRCMLYCFESNHLCCWEMVQEISDLKPHYLRSSSTVNMALELTFTIFWVKSTDTRHAKIFGLQDLNFTFVHLNSCEITSENLTKIWDKVGGAFVELTWTDPTKTSILMVHSKVWSFFLCWGTEVGCVMPPPPLDMALHYTFLQ